MKLTFLLPWSHRLGGTERSVITQINHLAQRHSVQLITLLRSRSSSGFAVHRRVVRSHLVDLSGAAPAVGSGTDYGGADAVKELVAAPSGHFEQSAGRAHNRLTDLELEHALRHLRTDVLITTAPPLLTMAARFAPPDTLLIHQEHRATEHRRGQEQLVLDSAPRADVLVSLTERSRDWLVGALGSSAPRLEVIPDALPVARPPRSRHNGRLVVAAGRLVPEKQFADTIRAFAEVVSVRPGWRLRIFGDGPAQGGLRQLIDELGLYDRVLLPGTTARMDREWAKASVGVLSSRSEGLGLSLIEAAAAGVPSVSYDSPDGPSTVISHGRTGRLVPPGDIAGLADAMLRLIDDEPERLRLGAAAAVAACRYAPDTVLPRWDALLEDLAATRRGRRGMLPTRLRREADRARREASEHPPVWQPPAEEPAVSDAGRAALQESRPDLLFDEGRLWGRLHRLPDEPVSQQNLDVVVGALERAGVDYFLMRAPARTRHRVGVVESARGRVLDALAAAFGDDPVYIAPVGGSGQMGSAVLVGAGVQPPDVHDAPAFRVFRYAMSSNGTLRFGAQYGCDIELWHDRGDALEPCRPGGHGEPVPEAIATPTTTTLRGRTYRSIEVFARRTVDDVDFPIDAVYTWVDGSDVVWQERKQAELARLGLEGGGEAAGASRFRSRDELRYSLRSLALYAPWIRHVYLVTDGQVPAWLDPDHASVTVVDHTEIFPSPECLPIFNSHALESSLHHIEGLADHYLVINDDILFGRPVQPQLFFSSSGVARYFLSRSPIGAGPVDPDTEPAHESARKNTRRLLEETFGRTVLHTFKHTPIPQLRPLMYELEERFPDAFAQNASSKFRSHHDFSLATTLHHYYGYLTGRTAPAGISYGYFNADDPAHHRALESLLRRRDRDVLCVNDGQGGEVSPYRQEQMLRAFFSAFLPLPARYERDAPPGGRAGASADQAPELAP